MAIAFNELVEFTSSSNSASFTTGLYTPAANALVLAAVVHSDAAPEATVPTFSGNGLTWVQVGSSMPFNTVGSNLNRITLFRAMGSSPTNTGGTATFGDATTGCAIYVCEFTGVRTSGSNGADAIKQSAGDNGDAGLPDIALGSLANHNQNAVFCAFGHDGSAVSFTFEGGWTVDMDSGYSAPTTGIVCMHALLATDTTPTWTDPSLDWGAIAVEIQTAVITISVGQATESDSPQTVTPKRTYQIAQATETDTARDVIAPLVVAVGQTSETDTSQTTTVRRSYTVAQTTEADTAQAVTVNPIRRLVSAASEADTAQSATAGRSISVAQTSETDTSQATTSRKTAVVGQASETDSAQAVTAGEKFPVAQASETDTAQSVTSRKTVAVGQASETDTAQTITPGGAQVIPVVQVTETDTAGSATPRKELIVVQVTEADTAQSITWSPMRRLVAQVVEFDTVPGDFIPPAPPIVITKRVEYRPRVDMRLDGSLIDAKTLVGLQDGDLPVRSGEDARVAQRLQVFQATDSLGGQAVDFAGIYVNLDREDANSDAFILVNDEIEILRNGKLIVDVRTTVGSLGKERFTLKTEIFKNSVVVHGAFHVAAQATSA